VVQRLVRLPDAKLIVPDRVVVAWRADLIASSQLE
jgi:hypothetical protein